MIDLVRGPGDEIRINGVLVWPLEQASAVEQGQTLRVAAINALSELEYLKRFLPSHGSFGEEGRDDYNRVVAELKKALTSSQTGHPAQPPAAAKPCRHGINNDGDFCPDCATTPAGDAVLIEQMLEAFRSATPPNSSPQEKMTAALAVARVGMVPRDQYQMVWDAAQKRIEDHRKQLDNMVSLDDVRTAFREHFETHNEYTLGDIVHCWGQIESSLTKPAEQTDIQRVEAILRTPWIDNPMSYHKLAAEIVAALRDGKEGK